MSATAVARSQQDELKAIRAHRVTVETKIREINQELKDKDELMGTSKSALIPGIYREIKKLKADKKGLETELGLIDEELGATLELLDFADDAQYGAQDEAGDVAEFDADDHPDQAVGEGEQPPVMAAVDEVD